MAKKIKKLNKIAWMTRQSALGTDEFLNERMEEVSAALRATFRTAVGDPVYSLQDVALDYVIVFSYVDGELYKMPYADDEASDKITFGIPIEVESQYVEVAADDAGEAQGAESEDVISQSVRETTLIGLIAQSADPEGWIWRVRALEFGMSATRDIWQPEIFKQSLPQWNGIQAYADHPTESEMHELPERSVRNIVGWYDNFAVTSQSFDADFHIKPSADWLRQDLLAASRAGKKDLYGFSILVRTTAKQSQGPDGKPAILHTKIVQPISIDVVTKAAAGGQVKYALASARGRIQKGATSMNRQVLALLFKQNKDKFSLVRQALVQASAEGVSVDSTEDQVAEKIAGNDTLVAQAVGIIGAAGQGPGDGEDNPEKKAAAAKAKTTKQSDATEGDAEIPFRRMPKPWRDSIVSQSFADSNLPEAVQQSIRKRLGADPELEVVNSAIEQAREVTGIVEQSTTGRVTNPGSDGARVITDSRDKIAIGLAKAFGLQKKDFTIESRNPIVRQSLGRYAEPAQSVWDDIPALRSLKRLYIDMTGDEGLTGVYPRNQRLVRQSDWLSGDFTQLLANVMGRRLLRDYRMWDSEWRRVVTPKPIESFKTQEAILLGYFGDLATVAEDATYTDYAELTNTQETYSASKRGKITPLTLETISNDDLQGFARINGRMGRAAARTLAKFIWNTCIMANPTLNADGVSLFNATHNNLITDALGTTGLKNAITKLLGQTEPGSNEALVLNTSNLTLAVPPGLFLDANAGTDFNQEPGGNVDPMSREIRRLGITPVLVPVFTDANDWLLCADQADLDMVEIGFWMGQEEPEFFTQNLPTDEQSFNKDVVMRVKVRHIYGGVPVDFRGMVKSVVA